MPSYALAVLEGSTRPDRRAGSGWLVVAAALCEQGLLKTGRQT